MSEEELHRCDGCRSERVCLFYRGLWFCISGPAKCWRHRENLYALKREEERRNTPQ